MWSKAWLTIAAFMLITCQIATNAKPAGASGGAGGKNAGNNERSEPKSLPTTQSGAIRVTTTTAIRAPTTTRGPIKSFDDVSKLVNDFIGLAKGDNKLDFKGAIDSLFPGFNASNFFPFPGFPNFNGAPGAVNNVSWPIGLPNFNGSNFQLPNFPFPAWGLPDFSNLFPPGAAGIPAAQQDGSAQQSQSPNGTIKSLDDAFKAGRDAFGLPDDDLKKALAKIIPNFDASKILLPPSISQALSSVQATSSDGTSKRSFDDVVKNVKDAVAGFMNRDDGNNKGKTAATTAATKTSPPTTKRKNQQ